MIKTCILIFVLLPFYISLYTTTSYAEGAASDTLANENSKTQDEVSSNIKGDLQKELSNLHSLLRDPVDEEHDDSETPSDGTHADEWTIQIHKNDEKTARELAHSYGFDVVSKVGIGDGVFRFLNKKDILTNAQSNKNEEDVIEDNKRDSQSRKKKEKREDDDFDKRESLLHELAKRLGEDVRVLWYKRERILKREKRVPIDVAEKGKRDYITLSDPNFPQQWYIQNTGQTAGPEAFDSNIVPVWKMGYTGKGVKVSVLDDGMDHTHPDLEANYDPKSSKDLNGHDDDPFPNDSDPYNAHGTKCSGTIAAKANNSLCGVGIAYDAKIGAIRMLDGKATDALEADALSFHRDHIDIYSCSWGPKDNGKTFGRPGSLGRLAFAQGAKYGRRGLGSLFVWATGNGGRSMDDCNADGYVNNIYTMGIGSVNEHGVSTYYGERCSAMFAVTYCSGRHSSTFGRNAHADVITTYLHHQCTKHFVGTSSAAPLAAGIFALVLEANPKLTWRDMQHLLFQTTKITSPLDSDWQKNGCGKHVNHKFGFGLIDALLLVNAALNWTTVSEQRRCHFRLNFKNGDIPSRRHFKLNFTTDGCQSCAEKLKDGKCKNAISKLEHVVVDVTLRHRRRGDLSILLISPHGTVSYLLRSRIYDGSSAGLKGWKFMTVFNWCENPAGTWQLVFQDNEPKRKRESRDYEEVYINYLDTKKRAQEMKRAQERRGSENWAAKASENNGVGLRDEDEESDSAPSLNADVEKQKYDALQKNKRASEDEDADASERKVETNGISEKAKRLLEIIARNKLKAAADEARKKYTERSDANDDANRYFHNDHYRREETDDKDLYHGDVYRRNDEADNENYDDNYGSYYKRKRREAIKKFDIDEENEKRMQQPAEEITYEDPILKKSILAGAVEKIAVTFYGTG